MEYESEQKKLRYFCPRERLTGFVVRLQTNDRLLREAFSNCYHRLE